MAAPLQGIRIVDMTTVMMGPYATQILGDFGADIVKVESPAGDSMRAVGPSRNPGMGALYLHANRNKRSAVIDLKAPEGRSILLKLLEDADVFVFNARPQAMKRLGLGYEEVAAVNPGIIYAGAHGFGSDGPYAGRPAYDDLIQGLGAVPSLAMQAAGGGHPQYAPVVLADRVVGLNLANVILAALMHRTRTGEGQCVEVPMFESIVQFVLGDHMGGRSFDPPLGGMGYGRLLAQHRRPYETRDGHVCVVVYTDRHWRAFFGLIGKADAFDRDPRLRDISARTRHIAELYSMVADELKTRSTADWLDALARADIPAMPLHTPESLLEDPHLKAVDFFQTVEHPTEGRLLEMRMPSRWSTARRDHNTPAPRLGEHTDEILRSAGFSEAEIDRWLRDGTIAAPTDSVSAEGSADAA
ncbi:CoA transferase (plasmid) [Azospirillum oryzae]|uniref:CoA transferase n=1 Tax=Azospirillum oryzae TaxID=286727 RepID=A0A6N1AQ58_9PROT|nr:CoA transferase [Azospirillum oryzae]KAA0587839.1 CoA transferase [Azospirillum oryzae]QKS53955.1 CoA transferase [Azospirillum oryzae]